MVQAATTRSRRCIVIIATLVIDNACGSSPATLHLFESRVKPRRNVAMQAHVEIVGKTFHKRCKIASSWDHLGAPRAGSWGSPGGHLGGVLRASRGLLSGTVRAVIFCQSYSRPVTETQNRHIYARLHPLKDRIRLPGGVLGGSRGDLGDFWGGSEVKST